MLLRKGRRGSCASKLKWWSGQPPPPPGGGDSEKYFESPATALEMLYELRVHHIELRLQNEELCKAQEHLQALRAQYYDLYDLAPVSYCSITESGLIEQVNLATTVLLGASRGALLKQPIFRFILPEDQDIFYHLRRRLLKSEQPQLCELRMRNLSEASSFWIRLTATAIQHTNGKRLLVLVLNDIQELKLTNEALMKSEAALKKANELLESKVAERTAELQLSVRELERSNQTLQEFAAIAAHDLQTPLRAIHGFSGVLREAHQSGQYQDTAGPLNHIMEAAGRMQAMTNDLLLYAQASDPAAGLQEVNLEQVFEEAAGTLRDALATLGGSLSHGPLPRLPAVHTEMVLLLRNLIGNAIKFHGTAAPRVHVSAAQQDGAWRVTVEDNGIGIDPRYHQRIFEVFRRLHGPQRYPGTGMGLALVKRMVEQRGGRVGVDSTPGRGSRFWFTIVDGDGQ